MPILDLVKKNQLGMQKGSLKKYFLIAGLIFAFLLLIYTLYTKFYLKSSLNLPGTSQTATKDLVFAPEPKLSEEDKAPQNQITQFTCPLSSKLCKNSQIYKNGELQTKLASGSALLASFDGEIELLESIHQDNGEIKKFSTIIIKNLKKGLLAYYNFEGSANLESETVLEGAVIAKSNGKSLPNYNEVNFVFRIVRLGNQDNTILDLKPETFK